MWQLAIAFVLLVPALLSADVLVVDQLGVGNADYSDIPTAMGAGGAGDTVLVAPGVYQVVETEPHGWPILLDGTSPDLQSMAGAEATIIEGDGSIPAFTIDDEVWARIHISGFTFRGTQEPVARIYLIGGGGGNFRFTDNIVEDNVNGLNASYSNGLIARNIIRNSGWGISIYHFNGVIESNEICYNAASGIGGTCCEQPEIRQNHIHHNATWGIRTGFYSHIYYNIIEDNGYCGLSLNSYGTVENNIVRRNDIGIRLYTHSYISLHHNDIYDNAAHDLCCGWPSRNRFDFDATMNWWGTTDPDEIADNIWDCTDDPQETICIIFQPFCDAPGCPITPVESVTWGAIKGMYR